MGGSRNFFKIETKALNQKFKKNLTEIDVNLTVGFASDIGKIYISLVYNNYNKELDLIIH
jgi:hypothetical protein